MTDYEVTHLSKYNLDKEKKVKEVAKQVAEDTRKILHDATDEENTENAQAKSFLALKQHSDNRWDQGYNFAAAEANVRISELYESLSELEKERDEFAIEFFLWLNNTWSGYVIAPYRGYVLFGANWLKIDALQKKIDNGDTNGLSSIEQLLEQFKSSK